MPRSLLTSSTCLAARKLKENEGVISLRPISRQPNDNVSKTELVNSCNFEISIEAYLVMNKLVLLL